MRRLVASALAPLLLAWADLDRDAEAKKCETVRAGREGAWDPRPLVVYLVVAVVLALEAYVGDRGFAQATFPARAEGRHGSLFLYGYWAVAKLVGMLGATLFVMRLFRAGARELGFGMGALRTHLWIYVCLYLALLPVLVAASHSQSFRDTYPFYRQAGRSVADCLIWEVLYGATFVAVEAFFRGLMLFPLQPALGSHAIFVMAIPYCMVHFGKPLPEVIASIFAGVLLGTLALRSRSIWGGVLLHVAVAWTMDALALAQTTGWPGSGRWIGE